jgi:hypothetical protein
MVNIDSNLKNLQYMARNKKLDHNYKIFSTKKLKVIYLHNIKEKLPNFF